MPTNANKNYEIIVDKSIYLCYNVFVVVRELPPFLPHLQASAVKGKETKTLNRNEKK